MHKGLTNATLGVLGAALLSGSVFAAGPTLSELPDVIISDKLKQQVVEDKNAASDLNVYDDETAATEDRYRFTQAFNLADVVTYNGQTGDDLTTASLSEVHYLFTEWADLNGENPNLSTQTIRINNVEGFPGVPSYADVSSSPLTGAFDNGYLSFVNQDRSGTTDAASPNPSPIVGTFTDTTLLTLYVASPTSTNPDVDAADFYVYTTNDIESLGFLGDTLSAPTSVWNPELAQDDLQGWYRNIVSELPHFETPPPGLYTRTTDKSTQDATTNPVPSVNSVSTFIPGAADILVTPAGTGTLAISTLANPTVQAGTAAGVAPQYAEWASWRRDHDAVKTTVLTQAGRLYMARWTMSGSNVPAPHTPDVRFRMGEATALGVGQTSDQLIHNGANSIVNGTKTHLSFWYAHAAGEIGFLFDVFDYYTTANTTNHPNGHSNYTLTMDKLEVFSLDPDQLGGGSVLLNQGGAVTLAAGEVAPPSGETGFATGTWHIIEAENLGTGNGRLSESFTASQASFTLVAGNNNVLGIFDTFPVASGTGNEILNDIPNDTLLRVDVWMSSPQGAAANNNLPIVRFGIQSDAWGESGQLAPTIISQGRVNYYTFYGWNRNMVDVGETLNPVMALNSAARRYTMFFTPNLHSGAATIDVRPAVEMYSFPQYSSTENADVTLNPDPFMAGTINVHRVVVTSYPLPAGSR